MSKYLTLIFIIFIFFISIFICEEEKSNEVPDAESQLEFEYLNESTFNFDYLDPFLNYSTPNIINLDDSNFTEEIKKYDSLYILYYAPWCGHCHEFIPKYVETADYCKEKNISIKFAKIDASKNQNASVEFEVSGYPSIYFLYNGQRYKFDGIRNKEGLLYFMKRKKTNDIFKINKLEELKEINNMYNTSLILLSTIKNKNAMIYKSFEDFSKKAIYMDFVSCLSDECYRKYGEDIILFKNFDEKENRYSVYYGRLEDAKNDSLRNFISIYAIETGVFAQQHDVDLAFEFEKQTLYYIRNSSIPEHTKFDYLFKEAGKEFRSNNIYSFVTSPDGNEIQKTINTAFTVLPEELPGIFYYDPYTDDPIAKIQLFSIRHVDLTKLNLSYIKKFIKDIKEGKIKRDLFSEFPSEDNKFINGMKYVIGKTFDKDVIEEKNNVFLCIIEGYGNDAENDFMDIFGNLTKKYQNDTEKKIRFNVMNINYNEPRDIGANDNDFPRAYLYTNAMDKKEVIRFTPKNMSEVTYEEFENFLFKKLNWKISLDSNKSQAKEESQKEKVKTEEKKNQNEDL